MTVHTALLAFFGGSDEETDLDEVAALLGTDATAAAVERELESLSDSINTAYGSVRDQLEPHRQVAVDATPREKAAAIERAVETTRRQSSGDRDGAGAAAVRAAANARRERRPASALARRLLDQVGGEQSASPARLEETFSAVVDDLEAHERAKSAVDRLDPGAGVDSVPEAVDAYREARREQQSGASDRERLAGAVEGLLDELDVDDGDVDDLEQCVRRATRQLQTEDSPVGTTEEAAGMGDVVARARNRANPRSRRARRLFDALEDGGTDAASALEAAATRLDEAATTDAVLENVGPDEVAELAADVESALADAEGPVADALRERTAALADRVDRAGDSNRVVAFAAGEELAFYRQSLVDEVVGSHRDDSGGPGDLGARLERARDRRAAVEADYVDERSDHNHSIPLYFLSLVDAALEDAAEHAAAGRSDRAVGALAVIEGLLDHVEGLYEQNQYSVMLRSLRG